MNLLCQRQISRSREKFRRFRQDAPNQRLTGGAGRYTARVAETALGRRIRQLRGNRTLKEINSKARIGISKLSKLERGEERNPRYHTLERVARGLEVPLASLFEDPRPEGAERAQSEGSPILSALLARLDSEAPAEDSIQGDILKALAALTRALRREAASIPPTRETEAPRR